MFIIIFIYSKNLNSLTNFLKFFYKLKKNKVIKMKFHSIQSQRKKKFSFFSTLKSPHVNKKSQEQFEYSKHSKKLKIRVSQITKFLAIWKTVKTALFPDVQIKTQLHIQNKALSPILLSKINYDKFSALKFFNPRVGHLRYPNLSGTTVRTSLSLLDIQGEILLKNSW